MNMTRKKAIRTKKGVGTKQTKMKTTQNIKRRRNGGEEEDDEYYDNEKEGQGEEGDKKMKRPLTA